MDDNLNHEELLVHLADQEKDNIIDKADYIRNKDMDRAKNIKDASINQRVEETEIKFSELKDNFNVNIDGD